MARLERLAVISKSLVSNIRPAEKTWMGKINQQSALEQGASTKNTCSGINISGTVSAYDVKRVVFRLRIDNGAP